METEALSVEDCKLNLPPPLDSTPSTTTHHLCMRKMLAVFPCTCGIPTSKCAASRAVDNCRPSELLVDTFEASRQTLTSSCDGGNPNHEPDEHTEYDCEALKYLLSVLQGLLRYEPEKRLGAREPLSLIQWVDYRRENESK